MRRLVLFFLAIIGSTVVGDAQAPSRDLQKEAAIWERLEAIDPELLETFKEATTRMDQDNYQDAAILYQKVVDASPTFDPAVRRLGICLVLGGDAGRGLP